MKVTMGTGAKLFLLGLLFSAVLSLLAKSGSSTPVISASAMKEIIDFFDYCYVCPLVDTLLAAITSAVNGVYSKAPGGLLAVLTILYAIWIAVFVMEHIASLKMKSGEEFFSDFIKKTVLVMIVAFLIGSSEGLLTVFEYILFPLIEWFVSFGLLILNSASREEITCSYKVIGGTGTSGGELSALYEASSKKAEEGLAKSFTALAEPIKCLASSIHTLLVSGIALGGKMLSTKSLGFWPEFIGLMLFVLFLFLDLLFPLQIFDSLFRMAIMMILFPLALMLSPFKSTRRFINIVFLYFLATVVHIAVVTIIFAVCIIVVYGTMDKINPHFFYEREKGTGEWTNSLSDAQLTNVAGLEMPEVAMVVILIYMIHIINLFSDMVAMVAGVGVGTTMSRGVRDKGIKTGLGVANFAVSKATGGRMNLK